MKQQDLYQKRCELILDYISQILVYGANTKGTITLHKNQFEDGKYLILIVSVIQNSYFRWHDLGILARDSVSFYSYVGRKILEKYQKFDLLFLENNTIRIASSVNHNQIDFSFPLTNQKEKEWFSKLEKMFYNEIK